MDTNPAQEWESAKKEVIYKAEKETEEAQWNIDIENEIIYVKHLGLSPLFLSKEKCTVFELEESSLFGIAKSINMEEHSFAAQTFLDEYNRHQQTTEIHIAEIKTQVKDSLINYKNILKIKLSDGRINKVQYDNLMTTAEETFKAIIPHAPVKRASDNFKSVNRIKKSDMQKNNRAQVTLFGRSSSFG